MVKFERILCPTDFSRNAELALEYACYLAGQNHSELHLLHVLPDITAAMSLYGDLVFVMPDEWASTMEKHANEFLAKLPEQKSDAIGNIIRATSQGETATEIVIYAGDKNIDLIVMGTHGKSNLAHILMGDTADKVLRKAHCPVMAIPSRKR
jgi:nucleotide-binding universal stress UspA family protein